MRKTDRNSIIAAIKSIDERLCENSNVDIAQIAHDCGFSENYFIRAFTEYTGLTPYAFINRQRAISAARLIADTDMKIADIAYETGHSSHDTFIRNFKRYFGVTPSVYRKSGQILPKNPFYISENIYFEGLRTHMDLIAGRSNFDWGKVADDYSKYRNIYPEMLYEKLHEMGVGMSGQKVVDIGTGSGILPYNMSRFGGEFVGVDKSQKMIESARRLCSGMKNVRFICRDAHTLDFADNSVDVITAVQCWVYFDKSVLIPRIKRALKPNGRLFVVFMTWLDEDIIIDKTFRLIKKYNPEWSGYFCRTKPHMPKWANGLKMTDFYSKDFKIPFTKQSWCGRVFASRGVGVSMGDEVGSFMQELHDMLDVELDGNEFTALHEAVIMEFQKE